jgi:futalosine hydrolase
VHDIVVCYSTALEGTGLPRTAGGRALTLLETGVGPVNAAFALTRLLAGGLPRAVIVCGVGGAYPGSSLEPGDVACATTETYGDLGAESPEGFLDMTALGFPIGPLTLDLFPCQTRVAFVTCATCTGTDARAAELVRRTGGAVESMEGAAIVHVARKMGVPVGEIRGISNIAGRRDRASWRLDEAAANARAALVAWIESGAC